MNLHIKRSKLKEILETNRRAHKDNFNKAIDTYRKYKEKVRAHRESIERDFPSEIGIELSIRMPKPEEHLDDYDRVIQMTELDTREEIELTEAEVRCYISDEWNWMKSWTSNTLAYSNVSP